MATAKQRAWRAKFARLYGGGKKKARRTKRRGVRMARHYGRRRRGGSGMNGMIKAAAIGALAGVLAPKIPILNTMPRFVAGAAGAYLVGGKSIKNAAIGGASAQFLSPMLGGAVSQVSGGAW